MSDRITIRLGPLAEPLREAAKKSGRTPVAEVRYRLAKSLRVKNPELKQGLADPEVRERAHEALRKQREDKR